jgi:HSP20 family protein
MKTDIKEDEKAYFMEIEIPGYDKKDVSLSLEKGYLTVSAEKKECSEKKENYIRKERSCRVSRTYYVGEVNKESIKAKYENGVLFIDIPKKEKEIPVSHNIEIE